MTSRLKKILLTSILGATVSASTAFIVNQANLSKQQAAQTDVQKYEGTLQTVAMKLKDTQHALEAGALLLSEDEENKAYEIIGKVTQAHDALLEQLAIQHNHLDAKEYERVRKELNATFGLKSGEHRITPVDQAQKLLECLAKVTTLINQHRAVRDSIRQNDTTLADLLSPHNNAKLPRELNNALGTKLLEHEPLASHLYQFARTEEAQGRATQLYNEALAAYQEVQKANNDLAPHRPRETGRVHPYAREQFLQRQQLVLNRVNTGNEKLLALAAYFDELHDQNVVFVNAHSDKDKEFSHTSISYDFGDGKFRTRTRKTDGKEFFYTIAIRTADGKETQMQVVRVGEQDSHGNSNWRTWQYQPNEQVGYVRAWKRMHYPANNLASGMNMSDVQFEPLLDSCVSAGTHKKNGQ